MITLLTIGAWLLPALCALAQPTDAGSIPVVDLTGTWRLNYELSDDPRRSAPQSVGQGPPESGYSRYRPGGFGTGFGGWGRNDPYRRDEGPSSEEIDRLRAAVGDQLTAPRLMSIVQHPQEILFEYGDGRYVRVVPDGRAHAGIAGTTQVSRTVQWEGRRLVADVRLDDGYRVHHTFEMDTELERLVVTTVFPPTGPHDEVRLVRVYELERSSPR